MNRKNFIIGILAAAFYIAFTTLTSTVGFAEADKVKIAMAALKARTAKLGPPKVEGKEPIAGKDVPVMYFGTTKMNNVVDVVDEVSKENGGTATVFAKSGDEYVRNAFKSLLSIVKSHQRAEWTA